jgi:uncharacterized membrane protein YecN with MAPEG domain
MGLAIIVVYTWMIFMVGIILFTACVMDWDED